MAFLQNLICKNGIRAYFVAETFRFFKVKVLNLQLVQFPWKIVSQDFPLFSGQNAIIFFEMEEVEIRFMLSYFAIILLLNWRNLMIKSIKVSDARKLSYSITT